MDYQNYARIRDAKGLNDNQVSKKAHIPNSTFSDWKSGRSIPKAKKLEKIADALEVDLSYLLGLSNDQKASSVMEFLARNSDFPEQLINIVMLARKMDESQIEKLHKFATLIQKGEL